MAKLTPNFMEELRKKKEKLANKGSGGNFLENFVQIGEKESASLRILPGNPNPEQFYAETAIHKVGENNFHCLRKHDEKCPLCELYFEIWKDINNDGKETPAGEAKRDFLFKNGLGASDRYYFNVYDRRDSKVKILSQGVKIFQKILDGMFDEDFGNGETYIFDTEKGWDFNLKMEKVAGYNNYDKSSFRIKSTPLAESEEEIANILAQRHDLSVLIKLPAFEEVRAVADAKRDQYRAEMLGIAAPVSAAAAAVGSDDQEFSESLDDMEA
jgi:hypothetical protein